MIPQPCNCILQKKVFNENSRGKPWSESGLATKFEENFGIVFRYEVSNNLLA